MGNIVEVCPFCMHEVELENPVKFNRQPCPNCKKMILPCNLCYNEGSTISCTKCKTKEK